MIPDHIKHAMGAAQEMRIDGERASFDSHQRDGSIWVDGYLGIIVIVEVTKAIANIIYAIDDHDNTRRIELYDLTPHIIPVAP